MAETTAISARRTHERRPDIAALLTAIKARQAKIGIVGLGYVGIPLALTGAEAGFKMIGFDIDEPRVGQINRGESFIKHIASHSIAEAVKSGHLEATCDFSRLSEPDAILICVPTPLTKYREPDLGYVVATAKAIAPRLRPGQLIVLESTTYPGTTTEVLKPIFEANGLRSGVDFFLAFSPEREDPGNPQFATAGIPKVVGGDGAEALKIADALYSELVVKTVPVSSPATAEAVKLTENIFRSVNIALVNELRWSTAPWASISGR
jgi:UDP-N-acetyl-D-glucosamine dehydrogenase